MERNNFVCSKIRSEKLSGMGYHLDSVEDWNIVAQIPQEIEQDVISYFIAGFNHKEVARKLPEEYKWVPEFISMYHKSYYKKF